MGTSGGTVVATRQQILMEDFMMGGTVALSALFDGAHTIQRFTDQVVTPQTLAAIYEHARWAPTAMNCSPLRLTFVQSQQAKQRLKPALSAGNVDKTMAAPVTAICAWDTRFYEHLDYLAPHMPGAGLGFAKDATVAEKTGTFSATLQIAYLIMAARSLGLGVGPMAGFDGAAVDRIFFADGRWRSLLLLNLGYAADDGYFPRAPRLQAQQATLIE